jgi:hypothetical protein
MLARHESQPLIDGRGCDIIDAHIAIPDSNSLIAPHDGIAFRPVSSRQAMS